MNRWIFRLTGMLVIVLLMLLFLDDWLHPEIPAAIEQGMARHDEPQRPSATTPNDVIPKPPSLGLTSYQPEQDASQPAQPSVTQEADEPLVAQVDEHQDDIAEAIPEPEPPVQPDKGSTESKATKPQVTPKQTTQQVVNQVDMVQSSKAWIQAGSFSERTNAKKRAAVIKAQGWAVEITPAKVNGKIFHRVYVGPIQQGQVATYLGKLQAMGIKAREARR